MDHDRITSEQRAELLERMTAVQAAHEELDLLRQRLADEYKLGPGDQILSATGIIVRRKPDAIVPAPTQDLSD